MELDELKEMEIPERQKIEFKLEYDKFAADRLGYFLRLDEQEKRMYFSSQLIDGNPEPEKSCPVEPLKYVHLLKTN